MTASAASVTHRLASTADNDRSITDLVPAPSKIKIHSINIQLNENMGKEGKTRVRDWNTVITNTRVIKKKWQHSRTHLHNNSIEIGFKFLKLFCARTKKTDRQIDRHKINKYSNIKIKHIQQSLRDN